MFEDVAFGPLHMGLPEAEVRTRVDVALEAVRMSSYKNRLSHHLSMGEKKRIAIATVLSMNPSILVLDEPSAGLDPARQKNIDQFTARNAVTMLVSTPDMALVKELFLRTIVSDGLTLEIFADKELLTAYGWEKPRHIIETWSCFQFCMLQ